jgi:hypothetical protein
MPNPSTSGLYHNHFQLIMKNNLGILATLVSKIFNHFAIHQILVNQAFHIHILSFQCCLLKRVQGRKNVKKNIPEPALPVIPIPDLLCPRPVKRR